MYWALCLVTLWILPCVSNIAMPLRASEFDTFSRSEMIDGVMTFHLGTSLAILSSVALSKSTRLLARSFTLVLDHFFFLPFPSPEAAAFFTFFSALSAFLAGIFSFFFLFIIFFFFLFSF